MGPVGPQTHPVVIFSVAKCITGVNILADENLHTGFLSCGVRAFMVRKASGSIRTDSSQETGKSKVILHSWRVYRG